MCFRFTLRAESTYSFAVTLPSYATAVAGPRPIGEAGVEGILLELQALPKTDRRKAEVVETVDARTAGVSGRAVEYRSGRPNPGVGGTLHAGGRRAAPAVPGPPNGGRAYGRGRSEEMNSSPPLVGV